MKISKPKKSTLIISSLIILLYVFSLVLLTYYFVYRIEGKYHFNKYQTKILTDEITQKISMVKSTSNAFDETIEFIEHSNKCDLDLLGKLVLKNETNQYVFHISYLLNHNKPVLHSFGVGIIGEKYSSVDEYKILSKQDLKPVFDILNIFSDDNYLVNEIKYEKITSNINLAIINYDHNKISSSVVSYFWNDTKKEGVSSTTYFINDQIEGCYSSIFFDFSICKNKCGLDFGTANDLIVEF